VTAVRRLIAVSAMANPAQMITRPRVGVGVGEMVVTLESESGTEGG
jgi:hypothetical protein